MVAEEVDDYSFHSKTTLQDGSDEERDEVREVQNMSRSDTRRIRAWRFVATGVLLVTAVAVTVTTFKFLDREEVSDFETAMGIALYHNMAVCVDRAFCSLPRLCSV